MVQNLYEYKNYKLFVLLPIALLLVSLFFIPKIQLDSSLAGGVGIQISTTSNISVSTLTADLDAVVPHTSIVSSYLNGVYHLSITMPANKSISDASQNLLAIYSINSNYSNATAALAIAQSQLKAQPGNSSLVVAINSEQANMSRDVAAMQTELAAEAANLRPLLNSTPAYNSSNITSMFSAAQAISKSAAANYKGYILSEISKYVPFTAYSYNDVTPTLGAFFLSQVRTIIIVAFILVAISVFFIFRTPIPSLAVIFGAANDIIVALGAMGAFGIPLGVASVGGLLMLIGYSIDTDMLSSIRVIKRSEGTASTRAMETMKTGVTMTGAAIVSFLTLFIVSYLFFIPTYIEISGVVLFGLIADIFTTWFGNTVMVVWYKKKREARWQS